MTVEKTSSEMGIPTDYVMALEQRIIQLENQIQEVQKELSEQDVDITEIFDELPFTALLSKNFFTRAFAVWGHFFVVQMIIILILYMLVFFIGFVARWFI